MNLSPILLTLISIICYSATYNCTSYNNAENNNTITKLMRYPARFKIRKITNSHHPLPLLCSMLKINVDLPRVPVSTADGLVDVTFLG